MHAPTRPLTKTQSTANCLHDRFANSALTALLTRQDVASNLATCLRTVDEAIAKGDLEVIKIGRSVRIRPSALELFIEARATRVNPRRTVRQTGKVKKTEPLVTPTQEIAPARAWTVNTTDATTLANKGGQS